MDIDYKHGSVSIGMNNVYNIIEYVHKKYEYAQALMGHCERSAAISLCLREIATSLSLLAMTGEDFYLRRTIFAVAEPFDNDILA